MKIVALAGGVGAGKFLRGLVRAVPAVDVTAVVNTGDDIDVHGLRVCPDLDSVTYWLGDAFDRERGVGPAWRDLPSDRGARGLRPDAAWFGLGDLDLATHLFRTRSLAEGLTLSEVTARVAARFGIEVTILPMTDRPVETRLDVAAEGRELISHFQEYWVRRGARDDVKAIRFEGVSAAPPRPGCARCDRVRRRGRDLPFEPGRLDRADPRGPRHPGSGGSTARRGISPIVGGRPLAGMADRLMPVVGLRGCRRWAPRHAYPDLLDAWVIDRAERPLAARAARRSARRSPSPTR